MRAAMSSSGAPRASSRRRYEPSWFMRTGTAGCACRPLGLLEQQRRAVRLAGAVGDLGHLEVRVDLGAHAGQLALAFQQADEGTQVHGHLPATASSSRRSGAGSDSGEHAPPRAATARRARRAGADGVRSRPRRRRRAPRRTPARRRARSGDEPRHRVRPQGVVGGERRPGAAQVRAGRHETREQADGVGVAARGDDAQAARVEAVAGEQPGLAGRPAASASARLSR